MPTPLTLTLVEFCEPHGARSQLARELGVTSQDLGRWTIDTKVPINRCPDIEAATRGKVPCETLRPDLPWLRIADRTYQWHRRGRPVLDITKNVEAFRKKGGRHAVSA